MKKPERKRSNEYDKFLPKAKTYFKLDEKQVTELKALKENGVPNKELTKMFNISLSSLYRYTSDEVRERHRSQSKKYADKKFVPGVRIRTKKQKERLKETDRELNQTIRGFFMNQYNSKVSIVRKKEKLKKFHEDVPIITLEDLMWLWDEHVRKYGVNCYYTGVPLTFYDPDNLRADTLCTIDRFDSEKGYTMDNIVFCCWAFNKRKNNISIQDCRIILQKHHQRTIRTGRKLYSFGGFVG